MESEDQICRRYEAQFAAIADLDRAYYLDRAASLAERRDYAARQAELEEMRSKLYSELASVRQSVKGAKCCKGYCVGMRGKTLRNTP